MNPRSRPTLHDVACQAGVSHMTVSRVVRGLPRVSPATRERVENAIRLLGYRPDPALSALAAYRTRGGGGRGNVIAFLECQPDEYSRSVFEGARSEAEHLGYAVEIHSLPESMAARRRLSRILFHRGVQGLLFGPSQVARELEGWEWEPFAPVSLGALSHHPPMHSVAMDYFDGAARAVAHLRESGASRVGLAIDHALEFRSGHRWLGGYVASQEISLSVPPYVGSLHDPAAIRRWTRKHQIDGVLTIHRCVGKSLEGQNTKVVFLNPFECPHGVAHVASDPVKIGREGIRLVHHQILSGELGLPAEIKILLLQGALVEIRKPIAKSGGAPSPASF